jgi:hypothetical protein
MLESNYFYTIPLYSIHRTENAIESFVGSLQTVQYL